MERPLTFQQLHRQRQREAFVGRSIETSLFDQNLQLPPGDPQRKTIIGVSGQGGMGKTTFMGHIRDLAEDRGLATAWSNEEEDDLLSLMKRLVEGLDESECFTHFSKRLSKYRELRHSLESSPEAPDDLARVIGGTAGRVGVKLARRVPVAGAAAEFLDEEAVGEQLGEIASYVLKKAGKKEDADLLLAPVEDLTPLFLKGLRQLLKKRQACLFFDTFEQTKHMVEPWLLQILAGQFGDLPLDLLIAISGRYPLDLNGWGQYEKSILRLELQPFSDSEAKDLLAREGVTDSQTVGEMIRLSHGLPILLASMAVGSPDDPLLTDTAVERVLRSVPEALRKAAIEASITRWLNRDLIKAAIDHPDPDTVFDWVVGMPFVVDATDGWKYHDVIRSEFLLHGRRESPQHWVETHRKLTEYFATTREEAKEAKNWEAGFRAELEHVYHGICTGDGDRLAHATALCINSWSRDPGATMLWAITIRDAEFDSGVREDVSVGQSWMNAIEELFHGRDQPALALFTKLLGEEQLTTGSRVTALMVRSDLYFNQGRLDAALADIDQAIELRPKQPRLKYERAWVHSRAERFDEALMDCRSAIGMLETEDPRLATYRVLEASILGEKQMPQEGLKVLEQIPELSDHSWGLLTQGRLLRELGEAKAAIRSFKEVVTLDKGSVLEAWLEIGSTYEESSKSRVAAEAYRSAVKSDSQTELGWRGLARTLARIVGKEDAKDELLSLGADLEDEEVCAYRAVALAEIECQEDALAEIERAVSADPSRPDFRLWMAQIKMESQQWGDATRHVAKALQQRPNWPEALAVRGLCRANVNDHAGALSDWEEAERMDPMQAKRINPNEWGLALSVLGRYQEAIEVFDRVDAAERAPAITYNRAVAIAMLEGVESAEQELRSAAEAISEAKSDLTKAYGRAGLACLQGDHETALSILSEALELDRVRARMWAETDPAWSSLQGTEALDALLRS